MRIPGCRDALRDIGFRGGSVSVFLLGLGV